MNKFTVKKIALVFFTFLATDAVVRAQTLQAVNDVIRTGPLQTVSKNIIRNDIIPGDTYSWQFVTATLPTVAQGTITKNGNNAVFTPATGYTGELNVNYELSGDGTTATGVIRIIVAERNNPVNIIDPDVECFDEMPENIPFGIHLKYQTSPRSSGDYIDGFTSPLVGDLNGDSKPEIVIMGTDGDSGAGAATVLRYINIYNGQTGARMYRYDFTTLGTGYSAMDMGSPYHRPPAILALADLDNDGMGEIVMCHAESGRVAAFKPMFHGASIVGMTRMWEGRDASGNAVSYKEPATTAQKDNEDYFGYPHPYIADLNGDGKPEVIVYNKIYNGATGHLLMAWQNAGTNKTSSYTSTSGLQDRFYATPVSQANANNVKGAAMVGRRPGNGTYADRYLPVPAIVDIDGDGKQEIITGNRIHKFTFNNLTNHTQNTYTTIEGPQSATVPESSGNATYYLSDGFTRVADVDGDNKLDIIVATFGNNGSLDAKVIVYVWDIANTASVKACVSFGSDGAHGNFSIPFVGDINGKTDGWNGSAYTRKLPEICILGGGIYINRANTIGNRTGVGFHPKANSSAFSGKFNRTPDTNGGHIVGLTWDGTATSVAERLKISWGMEHRDRSNNTGITLFDFDNNNAADLCYRDETALRVISPARSGKDYVELGEVSGAVGSSVMFSTSVFSGTAFEYPVIADVNMDGSADIVVTHTDTDSRNLDRSRGWINVYEYQGAKWAPCPPVWNQGMYDPTQVREDLKINARPISMLKTYTKKGETIRPYNGSWMQRPIVRDESDFIPVVRRPDAIITNMTVKVNSTSSTTVTLEIFNDGSATIAASAPVYFYDGKTNGDDNSLAASTLISSRQLGVDIFPNETKQLSYSITGNFNDRLVWATIIMNKAGAKAAGYDDCDLSNNAFSGADCPYLIYTTAVAPDAVLCGTADNAVLTAVPKESPHNAPSYQWYRNNEPIAGATSQTYTATFAGTYKCFVIEGICRGFSSSKTLTRVSVDDSKVPDIRIDVCPLPDRTMRMSHFIDSMTNNTVHWEKMSAAAPNILNPKTGEIKTGKVTGTFKYKYTMTSTCGVHSAIVYVHPLKNSFIRKIDTVTVCKDEKRSRNIQINQIPGFDLGGQWTYPADGNNTIASNMKVYSTASSYHGALVFDAYQAWEDATLSGHADYAIANYHGDTNAKAFVFR
jgi:hypothetical protein